MFSLVSHVQVAYGRTGQVTNTLNLTLELIPGDDDEDDYNDDTSHPGHPCHYGDR
ncbi:MAG: hypothetical protein KME21_31920 [Desmonostoc vinosum HA7617-LM4]|jgi:hypothetical protein|nr:hypothetical protein [Desmonostoc vinosum HA7617-LM4]